MNSSIGPAPRLSPLSLFSNAGTERFMRDWSGIATVTVMDSRNREHDPILGVVPRSSFVASTRLPPNLLGWDVGTF